MTDVVIEQTVSTEKNACIERCKHFGEKNKQRWVKETSSESLSHLYEALGERLGLYTEHYRLPALIALYKDLVKKHPGDFDAVIDAIRQLDNPENDVTRAEQYITTLRQKAEAQWQSLEEELNSYHQAANGKNFDLQEYMFSDRAKYAKPFKLYQQFEAERNQIVQEKNQLLEEKQQEQLTQEELICIREKQIALSIEEAKCQLNVRKQQVKDNFHSMREVPYEMREKFNNALRDYQYVNDNVLKKMQFFCETKNLFESNPLMRVLNTYSTPQEIAASDLYEVEKVIKDKPYNRSTDYKFCLLPEESMACSLRDAIARLLPEPTDINELFYNQKTYDSLISQLSFNEIYIQINTQAEAESEPVLHYFVRSRTGGLLEGPLTPENVRQILKDNPEDASALIQSMTQDTPGALSILQKHTTSFKDAIYDQLENQARELKKKKNGTLEEMKEYNGYERYGRHVGIYKHSAKERNQMIQTGFEYVFDHVMRPIAEERARLCVELRKLSDTLEKDNARLVEITDNPALSRQSCLSWSTEKDKLTRGIETLENSIELLEQKVDFLSVVLESNANDIKKGKESYDRPFSGIKLLTGIASCSAYPDSSYRQKRTGVLNENDRFSDVDVSILNQARDSVTNFLRKLVGVILIPFRAILGPCAPESLQKQALYNTQSTHRLFQAKSNWEERNKSTEKELDLPLRKLAL